ncbi:MAG: VCBS repeat-containing protein [Planctomycetes bacterium]|nr:VCBS repeat-containing protein [Planctomycetota bacterium]
MRRRLTRAAAAAAALALTGCGYLLPTAALALLGQSKSGGGVIVLRADDADLVISRGPQDVGDTTEGKAATVVVGQLRLTATKPTTLRTLHFKARGTGDDRAIPLVRLVHDRNGDGLVDAGDAQLGDTTTFSGDDGVASFRDLGHAFVGGDSIDVLVVITTPPDAGEQDTFGVELASIDAVEAVTLVDGAERPVGVFGLPLQSGMKTISSIGSVRVLLGPNSPPNAAAFPNSQDLGLLQLELRTSSAEPVRVSQLRLRASGSGNDAVDVARADLWLDVDSDGKLDLAVDQPIVFSAVPQADDGVLVFDGVAQTLQPASIVRWLVVYDLAGTAVDGATFRVDLLQGGDLVAQGVVSNTAVTPTGAPIAGGATITVNRASLSVEAGPFNPDRTTTPGATNVPALQLRLTAGSAEPVVVSTLGVRGAAGGGHEVTDLSSVSLWADLNGNGIVDAGEPRLAGPGAYDADGGTVVFGGFTRQLAAAATEFWLVTYDIAPAAEGADTFSARPSGAADVTVSGASSALSVTPTVSTAPGGTITVTGSLACDVGTAPPPAQLPLSNAADVPMVQVQLAAGPGEAVRVTSITVEPSGTAHDGLAVQAVQLWRDVNADGVVDGGDVLLATGAFPGDDQPLSFSDPAGLLTVPASTAGVHLLVRYVLPPAGQALQGQTLRARVDNATIAAVGALSGRPIVVGGAPTLGNAATVRRGRLTLTAGLDNPGPADVLNGQTAVPVLQLDAVAGPGEHVDLGALTLRSSGSANEPAVVLEARLYREGAGPKGVHDASDVLLGAGQVFSGDDGFVTFTLSPPARFDAGTTSQLLLVYDIAPAAPAPGTFTARLAAPDDVVAAGAASGISAQVLGPPAVGGQRTIRNGTLTALAGPKDPPVGTTFPNAVGRTMLQVELAAGFAEAVRVTQVRLTAAGTADEAQAVSALRLYLDANADGLVTPGVDALLASTATVPDDGQVTFGGLSLDIPAGERRQLLAVYDVSVAAVPTTTLRLRVADPALDVLAGGLSSGVAIVTAGGAVEGNDQTVVLGALQLSTHATNPVDAVTLANAQGVPMLQVRLTAGPTESVSVREVRVTHEGTGDPDAPGGALTRTRLYRDLNGNGLLDADVLLGTTDFVGGVATFALAPGVLDVAESATLDLLVVHEFNGTAVDGQTFRVRVADPAAHMVARGNSSDVLITPTAVGPIQGGLKTVERATLAATVGGNDAGMAATFFRNEADVEALQVRLAAGAAEAVRVTQLTLQAAGGGGFDPAAHVSKARVYREGTPPDGVLNQDALVGEGTFDGAGALVVPVAAGDLDVAAGGVQHLLVVLDIAAPAGSAGRTIAVTLQGLVATGVVSTLPVTPTGVPVAGQARAVKEAALALSAGPFPPPGGDVPIVKNGVEVLQVRLGAGAAEAVRIERLTFTFNPSPNPAGPPSTPVDPATAVLEARLYRDDDRNGRVDGDLLLGTATVSGGQVEFTPAAGDLDVPAGSLAAPSPGVVVLLAVDVGGSTVHGQQLRFDLAAAPDVQARGLSSTLAVPATGAPVNGLTKTARDVVLGVAQTLALPTAVEFDDATGVRALQLALTAGPLDGVDVQTITLTASGTADDTGVVARLYLDKNGNGTLDADEVPHLAQATFAADDGTIAFGLATGALEVPATETRRVLVLVDLPGTALDDQTYALRLAAAGDLVATGLSTAAPITVQGTFPVQGRTIEVKSTTLDLAAPAQAPDGSVLPNVQGLPVLRATATAGALEGVRVQEVVVRPVAGSHTLAGATLHLYRDDGDGLVDLGVDVLADTRPGDDAGVTFVIPGGRLDAAAGQTVHLLVVADLPGTAPAGATLRLTLDAGEVVARGLGSGAPVNGIGGGVLTGALKTVHHGQLELAAGSRNHLLGGPVFRGQTRVAQHVRLTAQVEPVLVERLRLQDGGTADPAADVLEVQVYRDDNGNGILDGDTLLGAATFTGTQAEVAPSGGLVTVSPGAPVDLLVVYALRATAGHDETFALDALDPSDLDVVGTASNVAVTPAGAGPAPPAMVFKVGALAVAAGPALPDREVVRGQQNVVAAALRLTASHEEGRVTRLELGLVGASSHLAQAELYHDQDGNGALSAGDVLIDAGVIEPGQVRFQRPAGLFVAPTTGPMDLLVVVRLSLTGDDLDTVRLTGPATTGVDVVGLPSGLAVTPGGGAGPNPLLTIRVGALTVDDPAPQPAAADVFRGQTGVVLRRLRVVAAGEPVTIESLRVDVDGDVGGLATLALYDDRNADGVLDPGDVLLQSLPGGASATFAPAGGLVTVQPGAPLRLLVVGSIHASAGAADDAFHVQALGAGAVAARGATSGLTVAPATTTSDGAVFTLREARLALAAGANPPAARTVYAGQEGVPVLQVRLTAQDEPVRVESLRVGFAGSGSASQVVRARLFVDHNANGVLDADTLLATRDFAGGAEVVFDPPGGLVTVPTSGPTHLLVVYDLGTGGSTGHTFGAAAVAPADVVARGDIGGAALTPTGSTPAGALMTLGVGELTLSTGPSQPPARNVGDGDAQVAVRQVELTAQGEPVRVDALTVRLAGTGGAGDVALVRLFLDANGNGLVDADTLLATGTFDAGTGAVTFADPLGLVTVGTATPVRLLVAFDLGTTAPSGATFGLQGVAAADLTATGAASGQPVTPTGAAAGAVPLTYFPRPAVTVAATGPAAGATSPREQDVVMLRLRLDETTGRDDGVLTSLTVRAEGTADDARDVRQVELWADLNGDGVLDPGEPRLGLSAFFGDDGLATFGGLSRTIPASGALHLLVTYDLGEPESALGAGDGLAQGDTLRALVDAGGVTVRSAAAALPVTPTGAFPLAGGERTVVGATDPRITVAQTLASGGPIFGNEQRRAVLALTLTQTSGDGAARLTSLRVEGVNPAPAGNDATDVVFVRLFRDVGSTPGAWDAGDVPIGITAYFTDPGVAVFAGLDEAISAGSPLHLIVTYDMADATQVLDGERYRARVPTGGVTLRAHPSGAPLSDALLTGLPLTGPEFQAVGPRLTVSALAFPPGADQDPLFVRNGSTNNPVLRLRLTANQVQPIVVESITITGGGAGHDALELAGAALFPDLDGNGLLDEDEEELQRLSPAFAADGGTATFSGLALAVPASGSVDLLVAYDLGQCDSPLDTFTATVADQAQVTVAAPATVQPFGALTGRTLQARTGVTVAAGPFEPADQVMTPAPAETPTLFLELTADLVAPVTVTALRLSASGSANDATDLQNARLYLDDGDLAFTPGPDTMLLAAAVDPPFAANDGQVVLTLQSALTIPAGESRRLWFSLQPKVLNGRSFRASFADNAHLTTTQTVFVSGADVTGPTFFTSTPTQVFEDPEAVPLVGTSPVLHLAAGDMDRDGDLDLVVLRADGALEVYRWNAAGNAFDAAPVAGPTTAGLVRFALGDVDQDGDLDVVAISATHVHVFKNDGAAGLTLSSSHEGPPGPPATQNHDLALLDYDRDGHLDVVVTDRGRGGLQAWRGTASGALTQATFLAVGGTSPRRIVAVDVDRDARRDLVWTSDDGVLRLARNNGGAVSGWPVEADTLGAGGRRLATGDLDRDAYPDVVVVNEATAQLDVVESLGPAGQAPNGLLRAASASSTAAGFSRVEPRSVVVGDWNGDGRLDVAIVHAHATAGPPAAGAGAVVVRLGDGDLDFDAPPPPATSITQYPLELPGPDALVAPDLMIAADFDRDGDADLVVASTTDTSGRVFLLRGDGDTKGGVVVPAAPSPMVVWGRKDPVGIDAGDVTRSGRPDFAIVSAGDKRVAVYRNDGVDAQGHVQFTLRSELTLADQGNQVRLVDLNADGKLDLVVTITGGGNDRISSFLGNGDGTFQAATHAIRGADSDPIALAIGDLNRDGFPDAAAAESKTRSFQVCINTGSGFSGPPGIVRSLAANTGTPVDIALADLDRDGVLDVVLLTHTPATIQFWRGTLLGSVYSLPATPTLTSTLHGNLGTPGGFALGDIDRDGVLDVVVVSANQDRMHALRGQVTGAFAPHPSQPIPFASGRAVDVRLVDLDKDGKLDIVAVRSGPNGTEAVLTHRLLNPETFGFQALVARSTGGDHDPVRLAVADFDLDGDLDVIAAIKNRKAAMVFLGQ